VTRYQLLAAFAAIILGGALMVYGLHPRHQPWTPPPEYHVVNPIGPHVPHADRTI
jgi:hypothetical protein